MITVTETKTAAGCIYGENCPLHAENPPFNAKALAAMQEAKDIASGKIPSKLYHSIEEAWEDLGF
jgi:hypothetical protein